VPIFVAERDSTDILRRRGMRLAVLIIIWDVIEGAIAVTAGLAAGSIALIGFGIDSSIEVFAAAIVLWQLHGGAHSRQRPALRAIAITFLVLALYIAVEAARDLAGAGEAGESSIGIVLNVVALAVMVPVAVVQWRTSRALDNEVLTAQAKETWLSNALSINVLAGLGLNAAFGFSWADPTVALIVAGFAAYAGVDAWREAAERHVEKHGNLPAATGQGLHHTTPTAPDLHLRP
jgi:divalent metal cation (Fe/Co/Zn/Cd) transporter